MTDDVRKAADPRPARSRAAILAAAREHFLAEGYRGAAVDEIAASAGVAKRTLYNLYDGKDALFRAVMDESFAIAEHFAATITAESLAASVAASSAAVPLDESAAPSSRESTATAAAPGPHVESLDERITALAVAHARATLDPRVIRLRRLLIGEAERFPELAAEYHARAPRRVMAALAEVLARLAADGELAIPPGTAPLAAEQFAFLVLGASLDESLFAPLPTPATITARARAGARVFLAGYSTQSRTSAAIRPDDATEVRD